MDEKGWRNVSIALGIACALLLGVTAALVFFGGDKTGARGTPSAAAEATPTASQGSTATASASATSSGSAKPSTSSVPTPSRSPSPTPKPTPNSPMAEVRFSNMMLDASADPHSLKRTFTFSTEGPGPVSVQIADSSPQTQTKLCLRVDDGAEACTTGWKPGFTSAFADTDQSLWTVTAIGMDITTPTVDIVFRWPAAHGQIQLTHGRFQGTGAPDSQNGFVATLKTRAGGTLGVQGSWTDLKVDASLTVADITASPAINAGETQFQGASSIDPAYAVAVDAGHTYTIELRNLSANQYRPDLSVSITFP